jgi:hypothetical protein
MLVFGHSRPPLSSGCSPTALPSSTQQSTAGTSVVMAARRLHIYLLRAGRLTHPASTHAAISRTPASKPTQSTQAPLAELEWYVRAPVAAVSTTPDSASHAESTLTRAQVWKQMKELLRPQPASE